MSFSIISKVTLLAAGIITFLWLLAMSGVQVLADIAAYCMPYISRCGSEFLQVVPADVVADMIDATTALINSLSL